jgi:hypothetical protein
MTALGIAAKSLIWLVAGARFELRKPSGGWVRVKVMSLKLIKD